MHKYIHDPEKISSWFSLFFFFFLLLIRMPACAYPVDIVRDEVSACSLFSGQILQYFNGVFREDRGGWKRGEAGQGGSKGRWSMRLACMEGNAECLNAGTFGLWLCTKAVRPFALLLRHSAFSITTSQEART